MTRVVLIALDGATLELLSPWFEQGHLPTLARLYREGAGGVLQSSVPWATPTAFASLATGTNPGRHGVYDFGRLIGRNLTSFVPTNGSDIRGPTVWKLLSDAGLRCGLVNVPMSYPAAEIDGFVIAGIPYPSGSERICHPSGLLARLRERGWDLARNASDDLGGSYASYREGLHDLVQARGEASIWLMQEFDPDLLVIHFLETDQVQHRFWQFMQGQPRYSRNGPHTHAIRELYAHVDEAIDEILRAAGGDTVLILMSDHGAGPTHHQVWPNNWLIEHGYLALKQTSWVSLKQWLYRMGLSPAAIREAAPEKLKLALLRFFERQKGRAIAQQLERDSARVSRKGLFDRLTESLAIDFPDVDWSRTGAFSTGTTAVGYVWLNVAGRQPRGIIEQGAEYTRTRQEIADALRAWQPVGRVAFAEELWHGAALPRAPDLVVFWADPGIDARYFQTRISSPHLIKPVPNDYAGHRREGIYTLTGPGVRGHTRVTADLLDLTPTLLWLFKQPVPTYMDGRVLTECFTLDHPVRSTEIPYAIEDEEDLSAEDEELLRDALRALGYLD